MRNCTIILSLIFFAGCAADSSGENPDGLTGERILPKSYEPPTPETLSLTSDWVYQGAIAIGGETVLGEASELTAFDVQLSAGSTFIIHGWTDTWTTWHIFGADNETDDWARVADMRTSEPLDPSVEGSRFEFTAQFDGHHLIMFEPVMDSTTKYLVRLECKDGC